MMIKTTLTFLTLTITTQVMAQSINDLQFGPKKESQGERLDGIVAIVGNDVVTYRELHRVGSNRKGLERLIMQKLMLQAAKKRNISVGDTALNIALDEARSKGENIPREVMRDNLMIQKLQQKVARNLVDISEQEVNNLVEQQLTQTNEKLQLVDILVRLPKTADSEDLARAQEKAQRVLAELSNTDARVVAKKNNLIYNDLGWIELSKIPTNFSKTLLDAPTGEFLQPIIDSDGIHLLKIIARKTEPNKQTTPISNETRVSHILIREKTPDAKTKINQIYRKLQQGANFSQLAGQFSQDEASAVKGGLLGWSRPGQFVPSFEIIMDKTNIGQISQPFKSSYGYHIVKVHERRKTQRNNREILESKARQAIFQNRIHDEWEAWLVRLRDEANVQILAK